MSELKELLVQKREELQTNEDKEEEKISTDHNTNDNEKTDTEKSIESSVSSTSDEILNLENDIQIINDEMKNYNVIDLIREIEKRNSDLNHVIENGLTERSPLDGELKTLKAIQTPAMAQSERIVVIEGQIKKIDDLLLSNKYKIEKNNKDLILLQEMISEKFTTERELFINFIMGELNGHLNSLLPKVVFWEYDEKYLQDSEVDLEELLQQDDLTDIPRPLVNIFRIGFGITSINGIKDIIREAQEDGNERNRISDQLTDNVNSFLQKIWADYKQEIKITLEKDELRVAIFDPEKSGASYYSLIERSQGCRTFISFLLTVGAEANNNVFKNTILLLDEPETHLHPSGVKFMLGELIKISESGNNLVFYATHSMFMIDRNNFERHIIVKKDQEISKLEYAYSNRIGSFMQEEVLYSALDIEFTEFDQTGAVNFVFEGYGDTFLFNNVYGSVLKQEAPFPLKDCVFHHGGGCDNIMKYLKRKSVKMNSKWIFILDSDDPAGKLKKFIESKYKDYLNKDVFVFQYEYNGIKKSEFEDLLPDYIKLEAYNKTLLSENKNIISETEYPLLIKNSPSFTKQYEEICKVYNLIENNIKGQFKEMLNQALKNDITDNNIAEKEGYSNYINWVKTIFINCKKQNDVQQ